MVAPRGSSASTPKPRMSHALKHARRIRAMLLIAKIDRLARNVAFIANLLKGDIEVKACDMPEANRLTWHILGVNRSGFAGGPNS
jgi:hypothetical protein